MIDDRELSATCAGISLASRPHHRVHGSTTRKTDNFPAPRNARLGHQRTALGRKLLTDAGEALAITINRMPDVIKE